MVEAGEVGLAPLCATILGVMSCPLQVAMDAQELGCGASLWSVSAS